MRPYNPDQPMAPTPGTRLGPYEILGPIGAGGMGEVFRARDTRLDRIVAIKVLPTELAADPQLRERFEREARAVSALQHPNICALYDVGNQDGIEYLVLEFLDGETIQDRLARTGALPIADALRIASDICAALDKAHRSGIVHRDLKPANVMLTGTGARSSGSGQAKLLDFGLAKTAAPIVATSGVSYLPTTPPSMTAQGTILGTFQYMAPEQIEGLDADARTDIFAFGALLYEMLTGRKAFEGKTRASLLGAILKDEAPRPSLVQPLAPESLDRIVTRCLAKDPDDRYQSARDVLHDLKWAATSSSPGAPAVQVPPASRRPRLATWIAVTAAALALIVTGAIATRHLLEQPAPVSPIQFTIATPEGVTLAAPPAGGTGLVTQAAASPDGRYVAFVGSGKNGYRLYLRPLGTLDATELAGTEGAAFPFWSPDSRYIAFFSSNKVKKVSIAGGPPVQLGDAVGGRGGTWNRDNVILFGSVSTPIMRVSAAGGAAQAVLALDTGAGETGQRFPSFLPDGRHFVFTGITGTCCPATKSGRLRVGTLDSKDAPTLRELDSSAIFSANHLLYVLGDGTLMAQPFDTSSRQFHGEAFPLAQRIAVEGSRYASFSATTEGLLVYSHGLSRPTGVLTWMDRNGKVLSTVGQPDLYFSLSLSHDEKHVAVSLQSSNGDLRDIYILDAAGHPSRFTFGPGINNNPTWSPDDSEVVFIGDRNGAPAMLRKRVAGTTSEEAVKLPDTNPAVPTDWSLDGKYLLFTRSLGVASSSDIWMLPWATPEKPSAVLNSRAGEFNGVLSPDGRWIAYDSNETGAGDVFVQPFPPTGGKIQVSRNGGRVPAWRRDGKELFFLSNDGQFMSAIVGLTSEFRPSEPTALFQVRTASTLGGSGRAYGVNRDGTRFLINVMQQDTTATPMTVVVNWPATVQR